MRGGGGDEWKKNWEFNCMLTRPKHSVVYSPLMKEQCCCSCCVCLCDCLCVHERRTSAVENEKRNKAAVTTLQMKHGHGLQNCVCVYVCFVCVNMWLSIISWLLHLVFIWPQCLAASVSYCLYCVRTEYERAIFAWQKIWNGCELRRSMYLHMSQGHT